MKEGEERRKDNPFLLMSFLVSILIMITLLSSQYEDTKKEKERKEGKERSGFNCERKGREAEAVLFFLSSALKKQELLSVLLLALSLFSLLSIPHISLFLLLACLIVYRIIKMMTLHTRTL